MKLVKKLLAISLGSFALLTSCETINTSTGLPSSTNQTSANPSDEKPLESNSSNSSSDKQSTSSSSAKPVVIPTLVEFAQSLKNYNFTLKNTYYSIDYYGKDNYYFNAIHSDYEAYTGGKIALGEKGIWNWKKAKKTKAFTLGGIYSLENTTDFSETDMFYQAIDVFAETASLWTISNSTKHIYKITDEDEDNGLLSAIPNFASYFDAEGVTYTATQVAIKITDAETATLTIELQRIANGKKATSSVNVFITNVGQNTVVDMPASITIEDPDDWPSEVTDGFAALYGDDFSLNFNTNFTFAQQYAVSTDANGNPTKISYGDLKSGNISTSVHTDLVLAGFIKDTEQSSQMSTDYGLPIGVYSLEVSPQTSTSGAVFATVLMYYMSSTYLEDDVSYPYGLFALQFSTETVAYSTDNVDDANAFIAANVTKTDGSAALPTFGAGIGLNNFAMDDLTDEASQYYGTQLAMYYAIEGKYDTDANALTALKIWISALENKGLTWSKSQDSGDEITTAGDELDLANSTNFKLSDSRYKTSKGILVSIYIGEVDENKTVTRNGYFAIYIMAY